MKTMLKEMFDHTTVIAADDPMLDHFITLKTLNLIDLRLMDNVGCEAFAKYVYTFCEKELSDDRVKIKSVRVFEHGANSAVFGNF